MGFENFTFLTKKLPGFKVSSSQIRIIHEPSIFYQELVNRSAESQNRIIFSALYWGVEDKEKKLRDTVASRLINNPNLKVKVLLDWCRGTRLVGGESSVTLLSQLQHLGDSETGSSGRCQLAFYQTPQLQGWLQYILPSKWNELLGLQHCKVYIFDNSLIISGANLSKDYFTNRQVETGRLCCYDFLSVQDRYVVVEDCKPLADYYEGLVDNISAFSLLLQKDGRFVSSPQFQDQNSRSWLERGRDLMNKFLSSQKEQHSVRLEGGEWDTVIFPTVQMGVFNIDQDCRITSEILKAGLRNSSYFFATGYFNLTKTFMRNILETRSSNYNILMAHPTANGFLGAKFPAGGIPHAYTLIARNFWNEVQGRERGRVSMWEYRRQGWTFHGKGLWYSEDSLPCLTMVGSPNFGYRSERRDLESQIVILTQSPGLQRRLLEEQQRLYSQAEEVEASTWQAEDRKVPLWVRLVVTLARKWF